MASKRQPPKRFAAALERLGAAQSDGAPDLGARLAAIDELGSAARESETDRRAIVEILAAYLRRQAAPGEREAGAALRNDLQAALSVIGKRHAGEEVETVSNLDLRGLDLRHADLARGHFDGVDFRGADLSGADLTEASLREAKLDRARLHAARLTGSRLRGASCVEADLSAADLRRADLSRQELPHYYNQARAWSRVYAQPDLLDFLTGSRTDLSRANLRDADLEEADLDGADLSGANLERASLRNANLADASLRDAKLEDADLTGSRLANTGAKPMKRIPPLP